MGRQGKRTLPDAEELKALLAELGLGVTREELKEMIREAVAACHKEVLSVKEAAAYLGVGISHLYKMMQARELPFSRPGGKKCFFRRSDLEEWMTRGRVSADEELTLQAGATMRTLPGIEEIVAKSRTRRR